MSNTEYEMNIRQDEDGTLSADIHCPAFADSQTGFDSAEDALAWAMSRTSNVNDPFTYEEN